MLSCPFNFFKLHVKFLSTTEFSGTHRNFYVPLSFLQSDLFPLLKVSFYDSSDFKIFMKIFEVVIFIDET